MPKREYEDVDVSVEVRACKSPISDEDNARYRSFLRNYEAKLEGGIKLVSEYQRWDDEVRHRAAMQKITAAKLARAGNMDYVKVAWSPQGRMKSLDHINFYSSEFYSTTYTGLLHWSNILMSYLLTYKCFAADIDFRAYIIRNYTTDIDLAPTGDSERACKHFFRAFLSESGLKGYLPYFTSAKKSEKVSGKTIRRATILTLARLETQTSGDARVRRHECFAYWEFTHGVLRFGVCDNMSLDSYDGCLDFRRVYQEVVESYVHKHADLGGLALQRFDVLNKLGFSQQHVIYQCTSLCRRGLLYFSVLQDITAFHENDRLEYDVDWSNVHLPIKIRADSMKMYRRNVVAYFYHLRRMQDWLLRNPMIWPASLEQSEPTEESPVCSIVFHPIISEQISLDGGGAVRRFLPLDSRLHMFKLVSNYDFSERYYQFRWDGDSPFQLVPSEEAEKLWEDFENGRALRVPDDRESCVMQAGYVPIELNEQHATFGCVRASEQYLNAPVPHAAEYHADTKKVFGAPGDVEDLYSTSVGRKVPGKYLDDFQAMLLELRDWVVVKRGPASAALKVDNVFCGRTSIFMIDLEHFKSELKVNKVSVRPCAEGHGFYKVVLYQILAALRNDPRKSSFLKISECLPENSAILTKYGFRCHPDKAADRLRDFWMGQAEIGKVTFNSWGMDRLLETPTDDDEVELAVLRRGAFPTAEMLNSQAYVDEFAKTRDHATAVSAMQSLGEKLDAPLPKGMKYNIITEEAMGSPEEMEEHYQEELETGKVIPDYYLAEFAQYLEKLWEWITGSHDYNSFFAARCSIIHFEALHKFGETQNEIHLDLVDVRPCAEGHGFYKVLLYVIVQAVKQAERVGTFKVMDCLPENSMILSRLGFQGDPAVRKDGMKDFWINKVDMGAVTFESWNMRKTLVSQVGKDVIFNLAALPTAEMLNSQVYVDTYAATKNHAAAVSAMQSAKKTSLDAPVPAGMAYHEYTAEYFTSPEDMEDFYTHESGEDVPDDYVEELCDRLAELWDWVHSERTSSILDEHCSVMRYTLRRTGDGVSLTLVHVRPCAAKHGFYKLFIYFIIQAVKSSQGVRKFTVLGCLPENAQILAGWNFTRDPSAMDEDKMIDFWMLKEDMGSVTLESWRMQRLIKSHSGRHLELDKAALPTAHQLNSQRYVDRYFAEGDHEVARRDMEDHEAAVEDMFIRESPPRDKKRRKKSVQSRAMLGSFMRKKSVQSGTIPGLRKSVLGQATLGAPVPAGMVFDEKSQENYGDPAELERTFVGNFSREIQPNYLATFQEKLKNLERWVVDCFNTFTGKEQNYIYYTDVTKFNLDYYDGKILVWDMSTRPCAVKHGFQKVVLYTLVKALKKQIKSQGILIKDVSPAMGALLSSRGFVKIQVGDSEDYELKPGNYEEVNEGSWKMQNLVRSGRGNVQIIKENFPTADMLNSQAYVDTYFATGGDHAKAVEAMISKRKREEVDPDATTDEDEAEPKRTKGQSGTFFEETIETYNELLDRGQLVRYSAKNPNMSFIPRVPVVHQQAINNRNGFLKKIRSGQDHYSLDQRMEILFESNLKENTLRVGIPLSNILMSYVLSSVVKVPYIDFKCYFPNSIWQIDICKIYDRKKLSSTVWLKNANTVQNFIVEWLKETQVSTLMSQIAQNSSSMPASMKEIIVWRRFLICGIYMTINDENGQLKGEGHEFVTFMQVIVRNDIAVLEFGILDNVSKRIYDSCLAYNFEHIDFILDAMEDYFKEENSNLVSRVRLIRLGHLHNRLDTGVLVTDNGQDFQYTCMTAARRAAMYSSFVIDLTDLLQMTNRVETATNDHEFKIYEELPSPSPPPSRSSSGGTEVLDPSTPQFQSPTEMYGELPAEPLPSEPLPGEPLPSEPLPGEPGPSQPIPDQPAEDQPRWPSEPLEHTPVPAAVCDPSELSDPKKRYRINLFSYMYYMRKMLAWIIKNKEIWPYWMQTEPSSDRPVCEILYYAPLTMASVSDMLEKPGGSKFHVLDENTTYLTLFNNFNQQALKYYFNPGQGSVFRHGPGMETPRNADGCVVSSRAFLAATLDAPIPAGRKYTPNEALVFQSVELAEQDFVDHMNSEDIPENYLAVLSMELGKIFTWIMTTPVPRNSHVYKWTTTPVMLINLEMTSDTLAIPVVHTRPCAEGHSFYKVLLFLLISIAKTKFARLEIKGCLENNTRILTRWGFQGGFTPEEQALIDMHRLEKVPLKNMWMDRHMMSYVTVDSWNMGKFLEDTPRGPVIRANAFPLAVHLNSQEYVDKFQETRNHELAVEAMSGTFRFRRSDQDELMRAQQALEKTPLKFLGGNFDRLRRGQSLEVLRSLHERLLALEKREML